MNMGQVLYKVSHHTLLHNDIINQSAIKYHKIFFPFISQNKFITIFNKILLITLILEWNDMKLQVLNYKELFKIQHSFSLLVRACKILNAYFLPIIINLIQLINYQFFKL